MRRAALVVLLAAGAAAGPTDTLTGVAKTKHFEIRYRKRSRSGASVPRVAVMAERDLARICERLGIQNDGRYKLFLYDDVAELHAITGTTGNAGFSSNDETHVPYDNDQTRFHELVHLVAYRLPRTGDEPRSLFFAEGLANALLEYVHDVHVHAVAAYYRKRKKLPGLAEMTGAVDFYVWLRKRPGFNGYDVGASWLRFLLDTQGAEKVRRYYTGTPANEAFGESLSGLEKTWRAFLDHYDVAPEVDTLLRQRAGERREFELYELDPFERLPEKLKGKPGDWKSLVSAKLRPDDPAKWRRHGDALVGKTDTPAWSWCQLGTRTFKSCVVHARIVPTTPSLGVQVRLGDACQAMIVQNGTFLYHKGRPVGSSTARRLGQPASIDLVLVRRRTKVEIWVDGVLVLEARLTSTVGPVGVGVAQGEARFEVVRVRALK